MSGAGNYGKYIDRNPIICTAGKRYGDPKDTVGRTLTEYKVQEEVDALKHDAGIFETSTPEFRYTPVGYKLPPLKNYRHMGTLTEIKPSLQPPAKTRYQTLIQDLKDTPYASYWNKDEGKSRDPTAGLPAGMIPKEVTFGTPTERDSLGDIVNPRKSYLEVQLESDVGHEMYKNTHNDYNPGEHRDRNYLQPPYKPNKRYGMQTGADPRGKWVPCALHWFKPGPLTTCSHIQADETEKTKSVLGKCLTPNHNIECVPKGFAFGLPCKRELYGMEELLKGPECSPCISKRDYHDVMKHLNQMRKRLKYRRMKFDFSLAELHDSMKYYDKENTGWIPLDLFYEICKCYLVHFEHDKLEALMSLINAITADGLINHNVFIELVDINTSVPLLVQIDDIPLENLHYLTTYRAANCDFLKMDNTDARTAGVPAIRYDLVELHKPEGGCTADIPHFGSETTAGSLVCPSVYTIYGVNYRDLFMPRTPDVMRNIFENLGYKFPGDTFERLWKIGLELDKTGLVCVETFKTILRQSLPPPTFNEEPGVVCN